MNTPVQRLCGAVFLSIVLNPSSLAAPLNCHLHAPDDYRPFGNKPLVIPSVGDPPACDRLNQERFASKGWCHCVRGSMGNAPATPPGFPTSSGRDPMPLP